jgi:hypothetical protein
MTARALFWLAPLVLSGACRTVVPASRAMTAKERHADALMEIVPPEIMVADLARPYAAAYTRPEKQTQAHTAFMRNLDATELRRIIREALLRHFSEAELRALAAFTPRLKARLHGQSAAFAAEVVPACAHEATQAFRKTALDAARGTLP